MNTYRVEYDGSTGPEDAEAGRTYDVLRDVDNRCVEVICSNCIFANANLIAMLLNKHEESK